MSIVVGSLVTKWVSDQIGSLFLMIKVIKIGSLLTLVDCKKLISRKDHIGLFFFKFSVIKICFLKFKRCGGAGEVSLAFITR